MYWGALRDLVPVWLGRPLSYARQARVAGRAARNVMKVEECIFGEIREWFDLRMSEWC
jgi:hypothetical protein